MQPQERGEAMRALLQRAQGGRWHLNLPKQKKSPRSPGNPAELER